MVFPDSVLCGGRLLVWTVEIFPSAEKRSVQNVCRSCYDVASAREQRARIYVVAILLHCIMSLR